MLAVYLLIYTPIILFVLAFLYETYLSFARLFRPRSRGSGYVAATWEVTNTLLVFGVVMLLMLFTRSIDIIAGAIFLPTMLAGVCLIARAACYIYIFYVKSSRTIGLVDWLFALLHVAAALSLVVTVILATVVLATKHPIANTQFVAPFIPGLIFVLGLCAVPVLRLYKNKT